MTDSVVATKTRLGLIEALVRAGGILEARQGDMSVSPLVADLIDTTPASASVMIRKLAELDLVRVRRLNGSSLGANTGKRGSPISFLALTEKGWDWWEAQTGEERPREEAPEAPEPPQEPVETPQEPEGSLDYMALAQSLLAAATKAISTHPDEQALLTANQRLQENNRVLMEKVNALSNENRSLQEALGEAMGRLQKSERPRHDHTVPAIELMDEESRRVLEQLAKRV